MTKVPAKGETVFLEEYGDCLFVSGPDMDKEVPQIRVKRFDENGIERMVVMTWDDFQNKRIYPEQQ